MMKCETPNYPECGCDYPVRSSRVVSVLGELTQVSKPPDPHLITEKCDGIEGRKIFRFREATSQDLYLRGIKASTTKSRLGFGENCRKLKSRMNSRDGKDHKIAAIKSAGSNECIIPVNLQTMQQENEALKDFCG